MGSEATENVTEGDTADSYLNLRALLHVFCLWDGVGHYYGFQVRLVESVDGWTREDPMGKDGIDLCSSRLF